MDHTVDRHKGLFLSWAYVVQSMSHQFLARAIFSTNKHCRTSWSSQINHGSHVMHGAASPHNFMQTKAIFELMLQKLVVLMHKRKLYSLMDGEEQFIIGKRLGNVVKSANFHQFHSTFNGAEGCHDQYRNVRPRTLDILQDFLTTDFWHFDISDDNINLTFLQKGQSNFRIIDGGNRIPLIFK